VFYVINLKTRQLPTLRFLFSPFLPPGLLIIYGSIRDVGRLHARYRGCPFVLTICKPRAGVSVTYRWLASHRRRLSSFPGQSMGDCKSSCSAWTCFSSSVSVSPASSAFSFVVIPTTSNSLKPPPPSSTLRCAVFFMHVTVAHLFRTFYSDMEPGG
jgi:hypothetical protein